MDFERLKRWQWILIGLILGLIVSGWRILLGPSLVDKDNPRTLVEAQSPPQRDRIFQARRDEQRRSLFWRMEPSFDLDILNPPGDLPYFQNLVLHPQDRQDPTRTWITLTAFCVKAPVAGAKKNPPPTTKNAAQLQPHNQQEFCYPVTAPYVPDPNYLLTPPSQSPDFRINPLLQKLTPNPHYNESHADVYRQIRQIQDDLERVQRDIKTLSARPGAAQSAELAALRQQEVELQKAKSQPHPELTLTYYLQELKAKYPTAPFKYRYAWEEQPKYVLAMYTGAVVILVGGIWPFLLALLPRSQKVRSGPDEEKLRKWTPSRAAKSTKPATGMTAQDLARLGALEQEMEKKLTADGTELPAVVVGHAPTEAEATVAPAAPVKQFAAAAATTPAVPVKPAESKEFGASEKDYYPTEVHVPTPEKP